MSSITSILLETVLLAVFSIHHMECGYMVTVTFHSVSNLNGTVASGRDCDKTSECDSYVAFCLRPTNQSINTGSGTDIFEVCRGDSSEVITTVNGAMRDNNTVNFDDTVFGRPNPVSISGPLPEAANGMLFYLEFLDLDSDNGDDLIDRFAIELPPPINSLNLTRAEYLGNFEIAMLEVSITAACQPIYRGGACDINIVGATVGPIALVIVCGLTASAVIILFANYKRLRKKRKIRGVSVEHSYTAFGSNYHALQHNASPLMIYGQDGIAARKNKPNVRRLDAANEESTESSEITESNASYAYVRDGSVESAYVLHTSTSEGYERLYWRPSDEERELMKELRKLNLKVFDKSSKESIGSGEFATVHRGVWQSEGEENDVAMKTLKKAASMEERVRFLQEAAIMGQFDHPYIVHVYGIVASEGEYHIIAELMANGSMLQYLRNLQPSKMEGMELKSQLLSYSRQIANGMEYLRQRRYIHRDLAARNILLSKDNVCKIADFGLSRDLQNEEFYLSHGGKIPVKWTAPEALNYRLYSSASDAWSYGIVLYEIWSLGCKPYCNMTNDQVMEQLTNGYRLPPPPGCPREVYKVMIQCWHMNADSRPKFIDLVTMLNKPEFKVLTWSPEDIMAYDEETRSVGSSITKGQYLYTELQNVYTKEELVPFL